MPVQLNIHTNGTAQLVRQGLEDLGNEIPKIGRKRIYEALKRIQKTLKIPKSRPGYPIQWDSVKQRKAFFASDGFGRGVPTSRSGKSLEWQIASNGNGYTLLNPAEYARHLYGRYDGSGQSRIFQGDYPLFVNVVENEITNLPEDIEEHITFYGRSKGF